MRSEASPGNAEQLPRGTVSTSHRGRFFVDLIVELLSIGYSVRFQAPGRSMHPTISDGEVITVEPANPSDLKRGDVILYRSRCGLTAHRVVRIDRRNGVAPCFVVRGDALCTCDAPVQSRQVLGRVASVERSGRSIGLYSRREKTLRLARLCVSHLRGWIKGKREMIRPSSFASTG